MDYFTLMLNLAGIAIGAIIGVLIFILLIWLIGPRLIKRIAH